MSSISSVRGYLIDTNLRETSEDRQSLNNLGGAPIADDIALFVNNTRNESIIPIRLDEFDTDTNTFIIVNETDEELDSRNYVFTNRDKVKIVDEDNEVIAENLYIINSNTNDQFQLSNELGSSTAVSVPVPSDSDVSGRYSMFIVRSDEVTQENLERLGIETTDASAVLGDDENVERSSAFDRIDDFDGEFNEIYGFINIASYSARFKYVSDRSVATGEKLRIEGSVIVADPSDTIVDEGISNTSPGLYLSDPQSDVDDISSTRAFSSTSNPWEDDEAGTLSTLSTDVTVGNLILNNGIKIDGITSATEFGSVDRATFTHKIKLQIDGIDYFLCLST